MCIIKRSKMNVCIESCLKILICLFCFCVNIKFSLYIKRLTKITTCISYLHCLINPTILKKNNKKKLLYLNKILVPYKAECRLTNKSKI